MTFNFFFKIILVSLFCGLLSCNNSGRSDSEIVESGYRIFGEENSNFYATDSIFDNAKFIMYDRFGTTASYKGFFIVSSFLVEDPFLIFNYPMPFSYLDWTKFYTPERFKIDTVKNHSKLYLVNYFINPPISKETNLSGIFGSYVLIDPYGDVKKQGRFPILTPNEGYKLGSFNWGKEPVPIEFDANEKDFGNWVLETEFKDTVRRIEIKLSQKIKIIEQE